MGKIKQVNYIHEVISQEIQTLTLELKMEDAKQRSPNGFVLNREKIMEKIASLRSRISKMEIIIEFLEIDTLKNI